MRWLLELVKVTADTKGASPDNWNYDADSGTASFRLNGGTSEYRWSVPQRIGKGGAPASVSASARAVKGQRLAPEIGMRGPFDFDPAPPAVRGIVAEPLQSVSDSKAATVKPRGSYSPGEDVVLTVSVYYALGFYYHYRPAKGSAGATPAREPKPQQPPEPRSDVNSRWLGKLYANDVFGYTKYELTLSSGANGMEGRLQSIGTYRSDPRRLYSFRVLENTGGGAVLAGEFQSDPVFESKNVYCGSCSPHMIYKKGVMRGTFRATFYANSGDSYYISFKESPSSEITPGEGMDLSFTRQP